MRWIAGLPRPLLFIGLAVLLAGTGLWAGLAANAEGSPGPPSPAVGLAQNRAVPRSVLDLPLEDQRGRPVTLAQFRDKVVFLVPFLTSCQEECPITTGALLAMQRAIARDGLRDKVAIVEATVDPWRDSPQRLGAYTGLTQGSWPMLTGSAGDVARLWQFFGVYYQGVPEASPPGIDWETNRPYTYDVNHSNGFIILDQRLQERFFAGGMANVKGLQANLRHLLDSRGRTNLTDPEAGSWTIGDGLRAIGWLLGRPVAEQR